MAKGRNRYNPQQKRSGERDDEQEVDIIDSEEQLQDDVTQEDEAFEDDGHETEESDSDFVENTEPIVEEKPKKKGSNAVWYGVAVVLAAAAVGGIYYSNQSGDSAEEAVAPAAEALAPETPEAVTELQEEAAVEVADDAMQSEAQLGASADDNNALIVSPEVGLTDLEHESAVEAESGAVAAEEERATAAEVVAHQEDSDAVVDTMDELAENQLPAESEPAVEPIEAEEESLTAEESQPIDESVESDTLPELTIETDAAVEAVEEEVPTAVVESAELLASPAVENVEAQVDPESAVESLAAPAQAALEVQAELEREFEVLAARQQQEIRRLQEELVAMQQHLQQSIAEERGAGAGRLILNDVSRLLQSAENELRFNGNVANAVSILTVAQRLAAESRNPLFEGLIGAIGADIVALKSSDSVTIEDMFKQVQQVATLLDTAPLNTPDYASHSTVMLPTPSGEQLERDASSTEMTAAGADTSTKKWYERAWDQTKDLGSKAYSAVVSDLGELVRVEKLSDPHSGLLTAEQAGIMRNNLKTQLGFAQQALMSRQQGIWQTSLTTVDQALQQYFRTDHQDTAQALRLLEQLRRSSVQPAMPDIAHSRRALSETYEQLRVQQALQE